MRREINIVGKDGISSEAISSMSELDIAAQLNADIYFHQGRDDNYDNFSGGEISDIVVWISRHVSKDFLFGAIGGGISGNFAYDALKKCVKILWNGIGKKKDGKLNINTPRRISIHFMDEDRGVEIMLEGEIGNDHFDTMMNAVLEFIRSEKINKAFNNSDNFFKEEKPSIRLIYNKETQVWEPENFGDYKRQWAEYQKRANENFKS